MYKLYWKKEEAVKHNAAKYFLRDVSTGSYVEADDVIVATMIEAGKVLNATLDNGNIVGTHVKDEDNATVLIKDIYNRISGPKAWNSLLYLVEETVMQPTPTAVLSFDPYRRVLATLECDATNDKYNTAIEETFLSYSVVQLFELLKECSKGETKLIGIGNYHDSISEYHAACFEGSENIRTYYPCEPSTEVWKRNLKFHICPKERFKKPADMPKKIYEASALVIQMLEEQQDIYCSQCGEVLYLHKKQKEVDSV